MDKDNKRFRADAPSFVPGQKTTTPSKLNPVASEFVPRAAVHTPPMPQQAYPPFSPVYIPGPGMGLAYGPPTYPPYFSPPFSPHHPHHIPHPHPHPIHLHSHSPSMSSSPVGPRPKNIIPIEPPPSLSPAHQNAKQQPRSMIEAQAAQSQPSENAQVVQQDILAESRANKGLLPTPASPSLPATTPTPPSTPAADTTTRANPEIVDDQSRATAVTDSPKSVHAEAQPAEPAELPPLTPTESTAKSDLEPSTPATEETQDSYLGGDDDDDENDPDYVPEDDDEGDEDDDDDDDDGEDDEGEEEDEDENQNENDHDNQSNGRESPDQSPNKPRKYSPTFMRQLKDENMRKPSDLDLSCIVSEPRNRGQGAAPSGRERERGERGDRSDRGDRDRDRGDRDGRRDKGNRDKWKQGRPNSTPIPVSTAPVAPLQKSENAWGRAPPGSKAEEVVRLVRGILNKIAPDSFDSLTKKILDLDLFEEVTLQGVIDLLFDKAVMESNFVTIYAMLSKRISEGKESNFRKLLISKCQMEFEAESRMADSDLPEDEKLVEARTIKIRMLGNIRFIGELYKLGLLIASTMKICINHLLRDPENPEEEDLEALCRLLSTIGARFERENKECTLATLQKLREMSENKENSLTPRIRFLIMDLIDLHSRQWVPKQKASGPKKKAEIHREIEMEAQRSQKDRDREDNRRGDRRGDDRRDRGRGDGRDERRADPAHDRRGPGDVRIQTSGAGPRQHAPTQDARSDAGWKDATRGKINRAGSEKGKTFGGTAPRQSDAARSAANTQPSKPPAQSTGPKPSVSSFHNLRSSEHEEDVEDVEDVEDDDGDVTNDQEGADQQQDEDEQEEKFQRKCACILKEFRENRKDQDFELELAELPATAGAKFFTTFLNVVVDENVAIPEFLARVVKVAWNRFRKGCFVEGLTNFFVNYADMVVDCPSAKPISTSVLVNAITVHGFSFKDLLTVLEPLRQYPPVKDLLGGILQATRQQLGPDKFQEMFLDADEAISSFLNLKKPNWAKFCKDFKLEE